MNISNFNNTQNGKARLRRHRFTGLVIIALIILAAAYIIGILTTDQPEYRMRATAIEENHILKERIAELEAENADLKAQLEAAPTPAPSGEPETPRSSEDPKASATPSAITASEE